MPIGSCDSWSAFFLALLRMVKGGVLWQNIIIASRDIDEKNVLLCALFGFVEVLLNMVNRIFDKKNVILLKVNEDDLNTFLVDMDIDDEGNPKYCLDDFTKAICNTIPEYVFAQYEDPNIPQNDIVEKLREAAHCIYKIKDFQLMKQWCVDKDINAYNELKRSSIE